MHKLLHTIKSKPGLYFGDSDKPFTSLIAFIVGYQCGFATVQPDSVGSGEAQLVGRDFARFVTEHYGCSFPDGGRSWKTFVSTPPVSRKPLIYSFSSLISMSVLGHHPSNQALQPMPSRLVSSRIHD
jgi:hypothetical protein